MQPAPSKTDHCLYMQLADELAVDIRQQLYKTGSRLPSVRQMSQQRQLSVSTVVQAYRVLEDRGLVYSKPQSGYFVRPLLPEIRQPLVSVGEAPKPVTKAQRIKSLLQAAAEPQAINLGAAIPALSLLPQRAMQTYLRDAIRFNSQAAMSYQLTPGYEPLRVQIAQRMRNLGIGCSVDEIMITQGCSEALMLSLKSSTQAGDIIAVESPCYYVFLQMAEMLGLKVIEIPTASNTGISLEALQLALQQWPIKLLALSSRFSNPSGSVIPKEKQQAIMALANQHDIAVVEDDIYGDIDFTGQHKSVLKSFDTEGRVMYCSSFSKTVAPGMRVGWCVPGRNLQIMEDLQTVHNIAPTSVTQCAMASYLEHGHYEKHLRQLSRITKQNLEYFSATIKANFPDTTRMSQPEGGLVLWLALPEEVSGNRLQQAAKAKGINIIPGEIFSNTDQFDNYIRLNYAVPWSETIKSGLQTLGKLAQTSLT